MFVLFNSNMAFVEPYLEIQIDIGTCKRSLCYTQTHITLAKFLSHILHLKEYFLATSENTCICKISKSKYNIGDTVSKCG